MTCTHVVINAKIGKIWKITTNYLKLFRARYRDIDIGKYDRLAFLTIDVYRKSEYRIRQENLSLLDLNFEGQLKEILQEEQKEI